MKTILFALALMLLSPVAARATTFNCYCQTAQGNCTVAQTVEAGNAGDGKSACTKVCENRSQTYCDLKDFNTDRTSGPCAGRTVCLTNPLKTASIPQLIANILKTVVGVVGALALLTFVYGGFLWLTSGGEAGKIQQGKDAMKWAIVGLAVVFSSYALVSFVLSALTKVT